MRRDDAAGFSGTRSPHTAFGRPSRAHSVTPAAALWRPSPTLPVAPRASMWPTTPRSSEFVGVSQRTRCRCRRVASYSWRHLRNTGKLRRNSISLGVINWARWPKWASTLVGCTAVNQTHNRDARCWTMRGPRARSVPTEPSACGSCCRMCRSREGSRARKSTLVPNPTVVLFVRLLWRLLQ